MGCCVSLDLAGFRDAWVNQIKARTDNSERPLEVLGYELDYPPTPCVFLRRGQLQYHGTFGPPGHTVTAWEMVLRVSAKAAEDAHRATDDYCATGTTCSLIDAVNADVTLGGAVGSFVVKSAGVPAWNGPPEGGRDWLETVFACEMQQSGVTA